ncbi:MAG: aspartate aminotransferase family protein [Pseudomonadota bacterium]
MRVDTTPNVYKPGETELPQEIEERVQRRNKAMGPSYRLAYSEPIHFVRGEGIWLYDANGQAYLDFYNNVVSIGHCHPRVVNAMRQQAETLCTNTRYLNDVVIEYSERLTSLFPKELSQVIFACTGSEANDLACRIAQFHTGGDGFIVSEFAYHGTSALAASMSPNLSPTMPLGRSVRTVPAPIADRHTRDLNAVGAKFEHDVRTAIAQLKRHGIKPAALVVDTIFSSDGVFPDPAGFLKGAFDAIRKEGGLFIADEVQPGFARTGEAMWGFERHGIVPDLVTIGKPMGNGYPMSGLIGRPDVMQKFGDNARYFNTFGGNTVAAANGLAVLDVIRDEELLANARTVGGFLKQGLQAIDSPFVNDVRGVGLYCAIDIIDSDGTPSGKGAQAVVNGLKQKKILISATGKNENSLKIRPPLIATKQNVEHFVDAIRDVISELNL